MNSCFCGWKLDVCSFRAVCYAVSSAWLNRIRVICVCSIHSNSIAKKATITASSKPWKMHFDRKGKECVYKQTQALLMLSNFCCKTLQCETTSSWTLSFCETFFSAFLSAHCINALVLCYLRVVLHFCGFSKWKRAAGYTGEHWNVFRFDFSSQCSGFKEMILVMSGLQNDAIAFKCSWAAYKRWVLIGKSERTVKKSHSSNGRCVIT